MTHPSIGGLLRWFEYKHLPDGPARSTSRDIYLLAHDMVDRLPASAELTTGLRKLLEAKDCLVRASFGSLPE